MPIIRPIAVSVAARRILEYGKPVLVASHRHGASLVVPGIEDVLFVSAPGVGLLPVHIIVGLDDLARIQSADNLRTTELPGRSYKTGELFCLSGIRTFRTALQIEIESIQTPVAKRNLLAITDWLNHLSELTGFGGNAASLMNCDSRYMCLMRQLMGDVQSAQDACRSLIGLGAGSTPAGDDLLIGALAYTWYARGQNAPLIVALRTMFHELAVLTTRVGATYLRAAIRGEFGSHLVSLIRGLVLVQSNRAIALADRVKKHGATSGLDTLCGFLMAADVTSGYEGHRTLKRRSSDRCMLTM